MSEPTKEEIQEWLTRHKANIQQASPAITAHLAKGLAQASLEEINRNNAQLVQSHDAKCYNAWVAMETQTSLFAGVARTSERKKSLLKRLVAKFKGGGR